MEGTDILSRTEAISAAAAVVLRGRGYTGVGIDEIAAAAGLSGPALYRYFDGKAEVLRDVVCRFLAQLSDLDGDAGPGAVASLIADNPNAASVTVRQFSLLAPDEGRTLLDAVPEHVRRLLPIAEGMPIEQRVRLRALYGAAIHCGLSHGLGPSSRGRAARRAAELIWDVPIEVGRYESPPAVRLLPGSKREAIMAVASDLFSQYGYGGVTLRDIGAALDVTASAVSKHFPSKEDVLVALFERASHQIGAALQTALRRAHGPGDAIVRVLHGYSAMAVDSRELIIIHSSERNSLSEANRADRRANQLGYVAEVRRLLIMQLPDLSRGAAGIRSSMAFSLINEVLFDERACGHRDLAPALATLAQRVLVGVAPQTTGDRKEPR